MKRRSFLGFLGGAAVAGPKLAQEIAPNAVGGSIPMSGGPMAAGVGLGPAWKTSRIAQLRKFMRVGDPEEKNRRTMQRLYSMEQQERYRLDGLRSVASHHKLSMLMNSASSRQERIDRLHWQLELSNLLGSG